MGVKKNREKGVKKAKYGEKHHIKLFFPHIKEAWWWSIYFGRDDELIF